MDQERADLMVFIDLAFLLLVGFLILTETSPMLNVALPAEPETDSTSESRSTVYNLYFDGAGQFLVQGNQGAVCNPRGIENLILCMEQVTSAVQTVLYVLVPRGRATVQDMVSILDMCYAHGWNCTVTN